MATTMAPVDLPARATAVDPGGRPKPTFREGFVPRPRLVRALQAATGVPLAAIVAPAGYGKTTLLAEWAAHDERAFAWVALDERDRGAEAFLAAVENALGEVDRRFPWVLVIDDAHLLRDPASVAALRGIAARVPAGSQLAVASRTEPPLPLGRRRAQRTVTEVRTRELTMTTTEGRGLLSMAGVEVSQADLEALVDRTEGWPAGLYLAAVALRDQPGAPGAVARFGGEDTVVSGYFRDELLDELPASVRAFLGRASVLDRLSGPACDAVLDRRGSARVLSDLARRNAMLVPLDRNEDSFRLHRLLRETLRGELRRFEPEREPELHRRASEWHDGHGEMDEAVEHAIAAGDARRAGALLWASVPRCVARGRNGLVQRWLGTFTDAEI